MSRPNLDVRTNALVTKVAVRRHPGRRRRVRPVRPRVGAPGRRRRGRAVRRRDQLTAAAAAVRRRQPDAAARPRHRRWSPTCPASGENLQDHLEVYVQHACTQPVSMQPLPREEALAGGRRALAVPAQRARGHQPLRGGRLRPQQRRRRLPEPDVPLPARSRCATTAPRPRTGTATRCTSGRCTPTPAAPSKITSTDPRKHPALRFNYLSTDQDRREWVEAIHVTRKILDQPALRAFDGGELSPAPTCRPTSRSSTGSATTRRRRCTRAAPPPWGPARWRSSTRSRCACAAPRACAWSTRRSCPTSPTATSTHP